MTAAYSEVHMQQTLKQALQIFCTTLT